MPDLSPWGVDASDAQARRPARGTNNDVRIIDVRTGRFVWRRYDNLSVEQVRTEHLLLEWLNARELPFQLPRPLRTLDGTTVLTLTDGRAVALQTLIHGRNPDDSDREALLTATGFTTLLRALAEAPQQLAPSDWMETRLRDIHGGVDDLDDVLGRLSRYGADVRWLRETLAREDDVSCALRALPQQIVHGDIGRSNALTDGARITGLLDFEIAGWDARISDVGTALLSLGGDPATAEGRASIRTLMQQFTTMLDLSSEELEVVPEVVRQRLAGSVIWGAGRWLRSRQGTIDEVVDRLHAGAAHVGHLSAYTAS
ncbi:phosphotransferase [Flexivirga caeni]|nr:phosphotransferase [Flexivirga caeni]